MFAIFIIIHGIICVALILVVLMQSSKGEGLAGAFGGGTFSGAVFGGRGAATFLSKATTVLAILFMVSCIGLTFLSRVGTTSETVGSSAVQRLANEQRQTAPPVTAPAQTPTQTPTSGDQSTQLPAAAAKDSGK